MSKKKKPILERQNRTSFKALESKAVHAEKAKELVNVETKEAREEERLGKREIGSVKEVKLRATLL